MDAISGAAGAAPVMVFASVGEHVWKRSFDWLDQRWGQALPEATSAGDVRVGSAFSSEAAPYSVHLVEVQATDLRTLECERSIGTPLSTEIWSVTILNRTAEGIYASPSSWTCHHGGPVFGDVAVDTIVVAIPAFSQPTETEVEPLRLELS